MGKRPRYLEATGDAMKEPRSDRRRDAEASPARELTARAGRAERGEATCGRKGNRVVVPPDPRELDEGVLVVQDREVEGPEEMAVPVQAGCSQQLLGDLLHETGIVETANGKAESTDIDTL